MSVTQTLIETQSVMSVFSQESEEEMNPCVFSVMLVLEYNSLNIKNLIFI